MWPRVGETATYILIYTGAILVHGLLAAWYARRAGRSAWIGAALGGAYFFGMFPGARILSELLNEPARLAGFFTADYWTNEDCWTLWGGPLAYLAVAVPAVWLLGRSDRPGLLDLVVLPLPVAMMLAKVACFANGCCYGAACDLPWAVTFPEGADAPAGIARHPVQIYEILTLLAIQLVFLRLDRHRWRGLLLGWFIAIYGAGRATAEFFRPPDQLERLIGPMSASQWVCYAASIAAVAFLIVLGRMRAESRRTGKAGALPYGDGARAPIDEDLQMSGDA